MPEVIQVLKNRDITPDVLNRHESKMQNIKDNLDFPSPEEFSEICHNPLKLKTFLGDIKNIIGLNEICKYCSVCKKTSWGNSNKICTDGCYLVSMGLITDNSTRTQKQNAGLYIGSINSYLSCLLDQHLEITEKSTRAEEKMSKLGRPSNFNSRTLSYMVYYQNAGDNKPTISDLARLLKISHTQVRRDLKALGWLEEDSSK